MKTPICLIVTLVLAACTPPPPPPPAPAPAPAPEPEFEPFPHERVWSGSAGLPLLVDTGEPVPLPFLFTPLVVIGRDSVGLRVRCERCGEGLEGWVAESEVVHDALPPEVAAWGSLAQFALSIRTAALNHDLHALRAVMAPDFTTSFIGVQSPEAAFEVWRAERFATLERLPALLDQGITSRDGRFWSAPPAFVEEPTYRGLRTGFRQRADGRWEWLYMITGILGD